MKLPDIRKINVRGKKVFLRADLDIPLAEFGIEDDTRLKAALPTIEYLLKQNAKIIIGGHLGRPKGADKTLSLEPIAKWFSCHPELVSGSPVGRQASSKSGEMLKQVQHDMNKTILDGFDGWEIGQNIFLLENLRFYEGEEENDPEFAKKLASLADVYINDAFAMCHRNHASIVGITRFLPRFAGFHLEQEISHLTNTMENPKRPLVVIVGGKKIETKLSLVEKMHHIADYVLVGGKIAEESQAFLRVRHEKIIGRKSVLLVADLTPDGMGITEKSLYNFIDIITLAKTVIWNGSMGFIGEKEDQFQASRKIAEAIIDSKAYSVVGGGDTVEFLNRIKLLSKFSFASTGGGAMLSFLSGEKLPGIEALPR